MLLPVIVEITAKIIVTTTIPEMGKLAQSG